MGSGWLGEVLLVLPGPLAKRGGVVTRVTRGRDSGSLVRASVARFTRGLVPWLAGRVPTPGCSRRRRAGQRRSPLPVGRQRARECSPAPVE